MKDLSQIRIQFLLVFLKTEHNTTQKQSKNKSKKQNKSESKTKNQSTNKPKKTNKPIDKQTSQQTNKQLLPYHDCLNISFHFLQILLSFLNQKSVETFMVNLLLLLLKLLKLLLLHYICNRPSVCVHRKLPCFQSLLETV